MIPFSLTIHWLSYSSQIILIFGIVVKFQLLGIQQDLPSSTRGKQNRVFPQQ